MFDTYPDTIPKDESGLLCGPRQITPAFLPTASSTEIAMVSGPYDSTRYLFGMNQKEFFARATDPETPLGYTFVGVKISFDMIPDFIPHPTYINF